MIAVGSVVVNSLFLLPQRVSVRASPFTKLISSFKAVFMPPKKLLEAYSNRTVRPFRFVSGAYLLYSLR